MKSHFGWLSACFILAALFWPAQGLAEPQVLFGTVSWIYDGDTIEVEPHGKIRLLGIDAPESESGPRDDYYLRRGISRERLRETATAAKAYLITTLKGKSVQISLDQTPRDKHNRLLGYVRLETGELVNQQLIERGLATTFRRFDFALKQEFLAAEASAKDRQRGLWKPH